MLVDSHCHLDRLDLEEYQGELSLALEAAKKNGVEHFLCVAIDLENFPAILSIAEKFPEVDATVGLHPNDPVDIEPTMQDLIDLGSHPKVVAIGETGLDYYRCSGDMNWQQQRFRQHIRAAIALQKPLVIHTRQAAEDTLKILEEENASSIGGVMHCFTESWSVAERAMELGFYISFSGIVTFQNARDLHEVVKKVPLERMLIETDSPYLAPVPHRGKSNQPAYVRLVAERIADLKETDFKAVAEVTSKNFYNLFRNSRSME